MQKFIVIPGLFAGLAMVSVPVVSSAGISLSINIAPPALQVYQQPICPRDGLLWTPGYWGYGNAGYYWIPGAWIAPPQAGFLWTPGYWGFSNGLYAFNAGYWGPTVGFYGGVNYGFGYGGSGFDGGRWQGGHFAYNTAVSRVNTTMIHNTYNQTVVSRGNNRTSFNGGPGGVSARPSATEVASAREHGQAPAVNNRSAEPQTREAARAVPKTARSAAAPQQQTRQVASNRTAAPVPARPAQQERPQATRAAAPERAAARPEPARPAGKSEGKEGKEERK